MLYIARETAAKYTPITTLIADTVRRVQEFTRQYMWYLKLDIRKYFDSIHHATLVAHLERRIKDRKLLALIQRIVSTYGAEAGRGVGSEALQAEHVSDE